MHSDCEFWHNSIFIFQSGEEKVKIDRPTNQPVWTISWNPSKYVFIKYHMCSVVNCSDIDIWQKKMCLMMGSNCIGVKE